MSQFANCFMCGAWFMFGFPVYAMNKVVSRQRISLPRDEFLASVNTPDRYERPAMSQPLGLARYVEPFPFM